MATPVISAGNLVVGEKDGFATFRITLSAPSASPVTVKFNNSNGTAANGYDYTAKSGTLSFAPGQTVQTVQVPIVNDITAESKESFFLNLFSPTNAAVG